MATIKGYKWTTKTMAEAAQTMVDEARNLPNEYVSHYFQFELGTDPEDLTSTFYFAAGDKIMEDVLGPAYEFQIYSPLG